MRAFPENRAFLRRVGAALIDGVFVIPLYWANTTLWQSFSHPAWRVIWFVTYSLVMVAYSIAMHARFGQTIGKMVTRIKVVTTGGGSISWRHAVMRDSVFLLLVFIGIAMHLPLAMSGTNPYSQDGVRLLNSPLDKFVRNAQSVWLYAELVTMWSNARRRAVHDFIAGTVVVRLSPQAQTEGA